MTDPLLMVQIGTKAQFIKTAPVLRELDKRGLAYRLVYTGQHSETFELLEAAFGTRPADEVLVSDFEAATHGSFLVWCFRFWRGVASNLYRKRWKGIRLGLVHGDTASTLFGAMGLRLAGARVAHIEAGLRSPRLMEPFPEEIVRRLVSRLARLHFVPDDVAAANLARVRGEVVPTGGNTLYDALVMSLGRIGDLPESGGAGGYAIASIHRSENLSNRPTFDLLMEEVCRASETVPIRFVLHPATREKIRSSGWLARLEQRPQLELRERMDYPDFVRLLLGSRFLLTDGGSNQEEAAMLGLPTLLLRRATERPDGLDSNVVLSGLQRETIRQFVAGHATATWPLRVVSGRSPSARLVDAVEAHLRAIRGAVPADVDGPRGFG